MDVSSGFRLGVMSSVSTLVIVSGGEEFLMERAARDEASSRLLGEVMEFRMPSGLPSYLHESESPVFDRRGRVFIAWDCDSVPPLPGADDVLVAVSRPGKELSDRRASRSLDFPKFKVSGERNDYVAWLLKEGESLNIDLSRVASALFVNCGERLRKLSSEVEKLATITPRDGTVTPDIARSVLCFSSEISPKDIIEAICEGKTAAALTYMDRLQDSGDETGWILSYLRRHVLQMIRLKSSLSSGVDETIVSESLGVNPFVLKKFLMPLQGLWSMESLISSAETLSSVDEMNKTGSGLPEYLLECEVVRLSQEAMNVHVTGR